MKSLGLICISLVWAGSTFAQLDTAWTRAIDLNSDGVQLQIDAAVLLQNGETMVSCSRTTLPIVDLWRLTAEGEIAWSGSVEMPFPSRTFGMAQMDEGHIIMISSFYSTEASSEFLLAKAIDQDGNELWEQPYPMDIYAQEGDVCKLSDNSIAVFTTRNDSDQAMLIKILSDGSQDWSAFFNPEQLTSEARDVEELSNGDLAIAGVSTSATSHQTGFVMRLSSSGDPIWTRIYGTQAQFGLACTALDVGPDDNILVGGIIRPFWWQNNPWAISLTSQGDEIWTLSGLNNADCYVSGIRYQSGDGAILLGTAIPISDPEQAVIYTVNSAGEGSGPIAFEALTGAITGMTSFRPRGAIAYGSIAIDNTNRGFVLRFSPRTFVAGFVRELDTNFPVGDARVEMVETGEFVYTDAEGHYALGVSQPNGTLRVTNACITPVLQTVELIENEANALDFSVGAPVFQCGTTGLNLIAEFGQTVSDSFFVQNLGNGDLVFSTTVSEQTPTYGWLSATPESGVILPSQGMWFIASVFVDPDHSETEFLGQIEIHHNSCPDTVSEIGVFVSALATPERPSLVTTFAVQPAYPNPFNGTTSVQLEVPFESAVQLGIYDIQGRLVKTVAATRFSAGTHVVQLDLSDQATGVYLLRAQAASNISIQKIVYLK